MNTLSIQLQIIIIICYSEVSSLFEWDEAKD